MNPRLRLGAIVTLLFAALVATGLAPAQADETSGMAEAPASADPYTVDNPNGSTDPNDPAQVTATTSADVQGSDGTGETVQKYDYRTAAGGLNHTVGITSASGCKEITGKVTGKNVMGDTIWSFKQTADWCWGGGKITDKYSDYTVTSPGQWWSFKGLIDTQSSTGTTSWIRYRQGSFAQCFPNWMGGGCYHKNYPWIRFYMYSNGSYSMQYSA